MNYPDVIELQDMQRRKEKNPYLSDDDLINDRIKHLSDYEKDVIISEINDESEEEGDKEVE